jgi:hypothetical protein
MVIKEIIICFDVVFRFTLVIDKFSAACSLHFLLLVSQ